MTTAKLQFKPVSPARRDAARTREGLLTAAFEEIYHTGFQAAT
ncbi:MAG: hypothetical protein WDN06_00755 [Asticcacaulis sp.]